MIRYALAALAAAFMCAPASAVVIYSGQVQAGGNIGYSETLQPGEQRQYILEISGGPLRPASLVTSYDFIEYRRLNDGSLLSTPINVFSSCFRPNGACVTEVPAELLPIYYPFTITALSDQGSLADCNLPAAIGQGVCFRDAIRTIWSFNATAGGPTTFSLSFVPEPTTWAMIVLGFAGIGATLRSRRRYEFGAGVYSRFG